MQKRHLVPVAVFGIAAIVGACQAESSGSPETLGSLVGVHAFEVGSEKQSVIIKVGVSVQLAAREYDAVTSEPSLRAQWMSRDTSVVSNVGSVFTAARLGDTYAVAQVTDHGRVFSDSVRITVVYVPPCRGPNCASP
jgi:hypothetical protein